VSLIVLILYFAGGDTTAYTSTGAETTAPKNIDFMLYWVYVIVAVGVILLLIFAVKTVGTMFKTDPKAAIKSIVTVAAFFVLLIVCYVISPEKEFSRIVNGEVETYSQSTMKMIDMWLYSIYFLIAATVVLVVFFAVKRFIKK
jgi:predicted nucleic acid-binding Zn ribbon protein